MMEYPLTATGRCLNSLDELAELNSVIIHYPDWVVCKGGGLSLYDKRLGWEEWDDITVIKIKTALDMGWEVEVVG